MSKLYTVNLSCLTSATIEVETDNPDEIDLGFFSHETLKEAFEDAEEDYEIHSVDEC